MVLAPENTEETKNTTTQENLLGQAVGKYIPDILDDYAPSQIVYDPSYAIVMSNAMIKGRMAMNIRESKIFRLLISQVQPDDTDFKVFQISINSLAKILCIGSIQSLRRDIKKIVANLLSQQVWVYDTENTNNWKAFTLLNVCETDGTYVKFKLSDQLKPYLTQLTGDYTQYPTYLLGGFTSTYALRIYELLQMAYTRSYRKKYQFKVDIDNLRFILQADMKQKEFYPNIANFKARVLDSAVEQINAHLLTEFTVSYILDKDGTRKVRYVVFTVTPRDYWANPQVAPKEAREAALAALELQQQIKAANAGEVKLSTIDPKAPVVIGDSDVVNSEPADMFVALHTEQVYGELTDKVDMTMLEHIAEEVQDGMSNTVTDLINEEYASNVKKDPLEILKEMLK